RERVATIPGIEEATLSAEPLTDNGRSRTGVSPDDHGPEAHESAWVNDIGYRFIETMRIPMIAGRSFDQHDRKETPPVAVVAQQFVRTFFPGVANAVGRTFRNNDRVYRIIGICGDTHFDNVRNAVP